MTPLEPTLTVSQLAASHPASVSVLQRYGIDLRDTSRTSLEDLCRQLSLDPIELLAEIRAEEDRHDGDAPVDRLVRQMLHAYHHVLREELPRLHRLAQRVLQAGDPRDAETLTAVLDAFLDLRSSVEDHVAREERAVAPLAQRVRDPVNGPALAFLLRQEHEVIASLLRRLRRVTRDFTPPEGAGLSWHELWRGLEGLEVSLHDHVRLVNNVLFLCTADEVQPRRAERSS